MHIGKVLDKIMGARKQYNQSFPKTITVYNELIKKKSICIITCPSTNYLLHLVPRKAQVEGQHHCQS